MAKQINGDFSLVIYFDGVTGEKKQASVDAVLNDSINNDLQKGFRKKLNVTELNALGSKTINQLGIIIANKIKSDEGIE